MQKKSNLNVKIDQSERDTFNEICKEEDTTMSQELRKFIRTRIKEYEDKNKNKGTE